MRLTDKITSLSELLVLLENDPELRENYDRAAPNSMYSSDLALNTSITGAWAQGHLGDMSPPIILPCFEDLDSNNFIYARENLRRQQELLHDANYLSLGYYKDDPQWRLHAPVVTYEGKTAQVSIFTSREKAIADERTAVPYSRYLASYTDLCEADIRNQAEHFSAEFDVPVIEIITDKERIAEIYQSLNESLRSCMTKPSSFYEIPEHLHPTMGLGAPGNVHLAVLWDSERKNHVQARTVVCTETKRFNRTYGQGSKMEQGLNKLGYRRGDLTGGRLALPIFDIYGRHPRRGPNQIGQKIKFLAPYLDRSPNGRDPGQHEGSCHLKPLGVTVHNGEAMLDVEVTLSAEAYEHGLHMPTLRASAYQQGHMELGVNYYKGKDKLYITSRTAFAHLTGYPKPRRFDISEIAAAGLEFDDLRVVQNKDGDPYHIDPALLFSFDNRHLTPTEAYEMGQREDLVVFDRELIRRNECVRTQDTRRLLPRNRTLLHARTRLFVERRATYLGDVTETINTTNGHEETTTRITSDDIQEIISFLGETPGARLELRQEDFQNRVHGLHSVA